MFGTLYQRPVTKNFQLENFSGPVPTESLSTQDSENVFGFGDCRDDICHSRHCRWQCKIFASGVNFFIFTQFFVLKLLKLGEIDSVKVFA